MLQIAVVKRAMLTEKRENFVSSASVPRQVGMNLKFRKPFIKRLNNNGQDVDLYDYRSAYRVAPEMYPEEDCELDNSFQYAISPVATFVQFLALMPVCGISSDNPNDLEFRWIAFRTVFTLVYISYGVFISVFFFTFIAALGISAKNIG